MFQYLYLVHIGDLNSHQNPDFLSENHVEIVVTLFACRTFCYQVNLVYNDLLLVVDNYYPMVVENLDSADNHIVGCPLDTDC